MSPLHRLARRASRRLTLARFIRTLGVALPICIGAAALAVLTGRLLGSGFPWWWALAAGVVAALAIAGVIAWRSRASAIAAASEVDAALKLKDKLGSALALESRAAQDPFASITIDEAATLAARIRVQQAIPIRADRSWWWWVVASAACVGIGIFVPPLRSAKEVAEQAAVIEHAAAQQQTQEAIADAAKKLEDALAATDPEAGDFAMADHQALLEEIREQLQAGAKEPEAAAAEAAALLEQTAETLEAQAADQLAAEAAAQQLANEAAENLPAEPGAKEVNDLIEAMRQGDTDAALKAAEALEKATENMTDEQIQQAAERLDQFAQAMEKAAQQAQEQAANQNTQAQQNLQNQGMSSQSAQQAAESAAQGASTSELQKQLQQQGMSEQAARDAAQNLQKSAQQQRALQQAAQRCNNASQSMREGSKNVSQCKGGGNSPSGNPGQSQGQSPGAPSQPGDGSKPSQNSGSSPGNSPGQEGDTPGENGQGPGGPGNATPANSGTWSPTQGTQPGGGAGRGTALHNLKQELTGAATKSKQIQRQQLQAQQLRVSKNDLLRQVADKSLQQKQQWLEQELAEGALDKNWRYKDDAIDVKRTSDDGEVISQQLRSGDTAAPYDPTAISRRELTSSLSTAMETTERAIEDRVIPARYRNIQRYFQKTMQRAAPDAPQDAPPAPPAPDAPDAGDAKTADK
jgi:hypothetical protein